MRSGVHMPAFTNPQMSASPICMHTLPQSLSLGGQMLHLLHVQLVAPFWAGQTCLAHTITGSASDDTVQLCCCILTLAW